MLLHVRHHLRSYVIRALQIHVSRVLQLTTERSGAGNVAKSSTARIAPSDPQSSTLTGPPLISNRVSVAGDRHSSGKAAVPGHRSNGTDGHRHWQGGNWSDGAGHHAGCSPGAHCWFSPVSPEAL